MIVSVHVRSNKPPVYNHHSQYVLLDSNIVSLKIKVDLSKCRLGDALYLQGPLEIALVFLCHDKDSEDGAETPMTTRHHHRLRLCFKEFIKR